MKKRLFIGIMLQTGFMLLSCYASDHFTERFTESRPFNLDGMSLTFTPDGSEDYYSATAGSITSLPVDSTFHNTLGLGDDDYVNAGEFMPQSYTKEAWVRIESGSDRNNFISSDDIINGHYISHSIHKSKRVRSFNIILIIVSSLSV